MHIRTVLGNIAPDQLGITLGHEHLLIDLRGLWISPPPPRATLVNKKPTFQNRANLIRNPNNPRPTRLFNILELVFAKPMNSKLSAGQWLIAIRTAGTN